jgi:hypothetical protein
MDHPMESISTEPAELLVRVPCRPKPQRRGQRGRKRTRVKAKSEGASRECIKLKEAADYLECLKTGFLRANSPRLTDCGESEGRNASFSPRSRHVSRRAR